MNRLPVLAHNGHMNGSAGEFSNEREILYKLFFDMKKDVTELKKMFVEILKNPSSSSSNPAVAYAREALLHDYTPVHHEHPQHQPQPIANVMSHPQPVVYDDINHHEEVEDSLNIMDKEKELIIKALKKHKSKRKDAASDLGISERTLYRKLKEYDIDE